MAHQYMKYSKLHSLLRVCSGPTFISGKKIRTLSSITANCIGKRLLVFRSGQYVFQKNRCLYSVCSNEDPVLGLEYTTDQEKNLQAFLVQDARTLNTIAHTFPLPKQTFNQYYVTVLKKNNSDYKHSITFSRVGPHHSPIFCCSLQLNGPAFGKFTGYAKTKKAAEAIAMAKAVSNLHEEGHMTVDGVPSSSPISSSKVYSRHVIRELLQEPLPIWFNSNDLLHMQDLIGQYKMEFQPFIQRTLENNEFPQVSMKRDVYLDLITCKKRSLIEEVDAADPLRNNKLFQNLRKNTCTYPILDFREEILKKIDGNQVTIIQGGTGCGKSTQVPQMIFDKYILKGIGSECNIVVSQPRRIATISLARWVAKQRGEKLGWNVGYKMRLDEHLLKFRGGIVFYTSGTLRQMMIQNPTLKGVSHIIVDEIHERTIDIDVLLALLKEIRVNRPDLKIILMSATIDMDKLSNYFDCNSDNVINISGKIYPVETFFMESLSKQLDIYLDSKALNVLSGKSKQVMLPRNIVVEVVRAIHEKKPSGAILVFVPGWSDIMNIVNALSTSEDLMVLPLHSLLSGYLQRKVFGHPPEGKRKVIVSTNIAETSLTIDDVVYVVDSGMLNSSKYAPHKDLCVFGTTWISKANAIQRAGRAGRVQSGEVYRLYTEQLFERFETYPSPEIIEQPLEDVCLRTKAILPDWNVEEFLEYLIDPPPPFAIKQAISNLCILGLFKQEESGERLTHLGRCVSKIATHPNLAKALIYGSIFRCFDTTLNIVSFEGNMSSLLEEKLDSKEFRELKEKFCSNSDLIAISHLVKEIEHSIEHYEEESDELNSVTGKTYNDTSTLLSLISPNQFESYKRVRTLLAQQAQRILNPYFENFKLYLNEDIATLSIPEDSLKIKSSESNHLVGNCFAASTLDIFRRLTENKDLHLYTDSGYKILVAKTSVLLSKNSNLGISDLALATNIIFSQERGSAIASELSTLRPLSAALFYGQDLETRETQRANEWHLKIKDHSLTFTLKDPQTAVCLKELRTIIKELVDFVIIYCESHYKVKKSKDAWSRNTNLFSGTKYSEDANSSENYEDPEATVQDETVDQKILEDPVNFADERVGFSNNKDLKNSENVSQISIESDSKFEFQDIVKFISDLTQFLGK